MPSIKSFAKIYDEIYEAAGKVFKEYDLCRWERNDDGSFSCIVNRLNSKNDDPELKETDGCCIEFCKRPYDFRDGTIKKTQHSRKKGCLVKSMKCRLHFCNYLATEANPSIKQGIEEIERLRKLFSGEYKELWQAIPYGSAKKEYLKCFRACAHYAN
jgi:hypothetical protein